MIVTVHYSQLRQGLVEQHSQRCDSYRYEVHPITGKLTLTLYQNVGSGAKVLAVLTGVCQFFVESL